MIGKLTGILNEVFKDYIILDVAGVGYLVYCSTNNLITINKGEKISLIIETYVREDQISLYGFLTTNERDWFKRLTTIKGVGNKVALSILNVIKASYFNNIILSEDKKTLSSIPGVGAKLSERIILELKNCDIISVNCLQTNQPLSVHNSIQQDAISALFNLGYSKSEAFNITNKILNDLNDIDLNNLIKMALKELSV